MTNSDIPASIGSVFREELGALPWAASFDFDRLIVGQAITEIPDGKEILGDQIWDICFPRQPAGIYGHHTDLAAFQKIIDSREIWLHAVAKQVRWGELELFARQFELDGYLATNERGERVLDALARDMFSLSLSEGVPSPELWGRRFGPVRMNLHVEPIFDRSELRRVAYAGEDVQNDHPFAKLREVGLRRFAKNLIPPRINRAGAFFLPLRYSKQQEVRLLVKRLPGSSAVDTKMVRGEEVLPISLEQDHERVRIQLLYVQVASQQFVAPVQQALAAVPHWEVGVQVVQK
ncbi:hypothetical protein [Ramlibacter algicola]|uniref:Uncharacterized protein n=1 Tax=Ramlibacter algicola TaxID=2795217 RepID=A0A934UQ04_9BURK|nr:hypothetical protein [Ramlibacter algicola]MBK0392109.1 hypothetical protein [Ramlibacter algicola]